MTTLVSITCLDNKAKYMTTKMSRLIIIVLIRA